MNDIQRQCHPTDGSVTSTVVRVPYGAAATSALGDIVRELQGDESGRYWREIYLVVRDGGRVLEGYVDLLVEDSEGGLVDVDYKTDRATTSAQVAGKAKHYRPQLAAYGQALTQVLDREISRGALVIARPRPRSRSCSS